MSDEARREELQFVEEQIKKLDFRTIRCRDARLLVRVLRDATGRISPGVSGETCGGVGQLRFLWVEESRARPGLGSQLLRAAEEEATASGCVKMVLSTHSFQAPAFCRKRGYVLVGKLSDYPWVRFDLLGEASSWAWRRRRVNWLSSEDGCLSRDRNARD